MGCSEGKARIHGAMVLKQGDSNVDPAYAAMPFEERAKFFLKHGIPVDPNAELKERQRSTPVQTQARPYSAADVERLREARQQEEAEKEARQRSACRQAEEDAKLSEAIALQNSLAQASRSSRRRGAGEAVQAQKERESQPEQAETQEKELSKGQARRLRQRANRANRAAAQQRASELEATQQWLRETQGFIPQNPLPEPTSATSAKKKATRSRVPPEVAQSQVAEDLLMGLWEAKHKHADQRKRQKAPPTCHRFGHGPCRELSLPFFHKSR